MKKYVLFLLYFSCSIIKSSQPIVDMQAFEKFLRANDMREIEQLIHGDFSPMYAYKSLQEVRDPWGKVTIWKKEKDITLRKTEVDTYHHMVAHALKKIKMRREVLKKELDDNLIPDDNYLKERDAIYLEADSYFIRIMDIVVRFSLYIQYCFGVYKLGDLKNDSFAKKFITLKLDNLDLKRKPVWKFFDTSYKLNNVIDAYNILTSMKNRLEKSIEQYIEKPKKDECALLFSKQGIYLNKDCPYQDMPKEVIQAHIIPHLLSQDIKVSQKDIVLSAYWGDGQDSWWFETSPPAGRIYIDSKPIEIRGEISRVLYYAPALPTAIRKKGYAWSDED